MRSEDQQMSSPKKRASGVGKQPPCVDEGNYASGIEGGK